jgi:hypothetical protein
MNKYKIGVIVLFALALVTLAGCFGSKPYEYRGERPDLYSVATHTVLGSVGYILEEVKFDPEIRVLEEDSYGRTLFLYSEGGLVSAYSLVVQQQSDDGDAYYYSDTCFISSPDEEFSDQEILQLKQRNDWGMAFDPEKCERVAISLEKEEGPMKTGELARFYKQVFGDEAASRPAYNIDYFVTDRYGRSMYLASGEWRGEGADSDRRYVVMLFDAEGECDETEGVLDLPDPNAYQDDLKAFKERNGWNTPV